MRDTESLEKMFAKKPGKHSVKRDPGSRYKNKRNKPDIKAVVAPKLTAEQRVFLEGRVHEINLELTESLESDVHYAFSDEYTAIIENLDMINRMLNGSKIKHKHKHKGD